MRKKNSRNIYSTAESIRLIYSGNDYFAELEKIIHNAKEEIYIQMYIFESDQTGKHIIEALIKSARRGVKIYLLIDAFGSKSLNKEIISKLTDAGIHFRWYAPFFKNWRIRTGRRLHNKVIVADNKTAIVGGINIADKYQDSPKGIGWLDYALIIEGKIAKELQAYCHKIYYRKFYKRKIKYHRNGHHKDLILVRYRENDWIRKKNLITKSYIHAFSKAKTSIYIVGAYFLPGRKTRSLLKKATQRGVEIKVLMSGVSDVQFIVPAQRYLYQWMLKNNIKIYEWDKSVVHGKVASVDDNWMTIGSFNLNYLSIYGNIELNIDLIHPTTVKEFNHHLESIIFPQCTEITKNYREEKDNIFKKFNRWISYQLIRFSMILTVFFYSRPIKKNMP